MTTMPVDALPMFTEKLNNRNSTQYSLLPIEQNVIDATDIQ